LGQRLEICHDPQNYKVESIVYVVTMLFGLCETFDPESALGSQPAVAQITSGSPDQEDHMRLVLAFTVGLLLAGGSAAAAPQFAMPSKAAIGAASFLQLVAGGCGVGFHRQGWRDRYGHWHVHCVPNR
jgi:hypothetical protein